MGIHAFESSCDLNGDLSENGHKTQQHFNIKAKSEMKGIKKFSSQQREQPDLRSPVKASQWHLESAELVDAAARPRLLMAPSSDPRSWLRLPRCLISQQK